MSESDPDLLLRQQRRELRATILRTAKLVYGQGGKVTFENFAHVAGRDKRALITEEVRYLVDKGYLREISAKRDALDHAPPTVYQLTARGVELLNGDIEDA